ncbi:unnamed protein product [Symbiodinium microadriaticum]|nr:unnamed protein product [Symbiodinium microadriaticum]
MRLLGAAAVEHRRPRPSGGRGRCRSLSASTTTRPFAFCISAFGDARLEADRIYDSPLEVYAALREEDGGIAQWILPAVYGGHLSSVWWVRPPGSQQISDGTYRCHVGRSLGPRGKTTDGHEEDEDEAQVEGIKISCSEPYFVEDGIYSPEKSLRCSQPLDLRVSLLPGEDQPLPAWRGTGEPNSSHEDHPWLLDVCLDYFACENPFLSQVRPKVAAPLAQIHFAAAFRQGPVLDQSDFDVQRAAFDAAYEEVLRCAEACPRGHQELERAMDRLLGFLPVAQQALHRPALRDALIDARGSELRALQEAGDMISLPSFRPSTTELREQLKAVESFVARLGGRPCAVTVARSVTDGFCPMRCHCMLEAGVLEMLQRLFGEMDVMYGDELDAKEQQP